VDEGPPLRTATNKRVDPQSPSSAGEALRFLDAMPDRLQTMVTTAEKRS
jgi:hypothetical protein